MSINYPTSLDTLVNPTSSDGLNSPNHADQHSNANDAIEALEAKVGVNSSAVTTSHDYKLSSITGTDKALKSGTSIQTVSGLTLTAPQINFGSDARGDIMVRNSSGVSSRLPIGTSGQILAANASGDLEYIANPAAADATYTVKGVDYKKANSEYYAADVGSNDTYVITLSPAPTAYVTGQEFSFKANTVNTGAATLNVNGLGAKTIVKYVNTTLADGDIAANMICTVRYDGTNFVLQNPVANAPLTTAPLPTQTIPYYIGTSTGMGTVFASNQAGTIAFLGYYNGSSSVLIYRLALDSITGQYIMTHTATWTLSTSTLDSLSFGVTTNYLYAVIRDNGTMTLRRFDIADLANPTAITISGATGTLSGNGTGFSDGIDLYFYKNVAATMQKYTISGTTATNAADVVYTAGDPQYGNTCNGTYVYITETTSYVVTIKKYALAGGALISSTTGTIFTGAYPNPSNYAVPFIRNSTALGLVFFHSNCSATAIIGYSAELSAMTLL